MSARSAVIAAAVAVAAFVFAFRTKERPPRLPTRHAAALAVTGHSGAGKSALGVTTSADLIPADQGTFSEKEYDLLWREYRPNTPQAQGPLPAARLDVLARATNTNTRDRKIWPAFSDVIYGKSVPLENRLDTGLSPDATIHLDYPYDADFSLLDMAIEAGQRAVIRQLLRHGASVNPLTKVAPNGTPVDVEAPLPIAAGDGEDDVVRMLLQNGADISQRRGLRGNDQTALGAAVYAQNASTAYLLLTHGADVRPALGPGGAMPSILTPPYVTPRMIALRNLLMAYGAKMPSEQPCTNGSVFQRPASCSAGR